MMSQECLCRDILVVMLLDKTEINLEAKKLYLKKQYPALSCYINKAERHQYLQIAIVNGFIHKCPST